MRPESYHIIPDDLVAKVIPADTRVIICGKYVPKPHICRSCSGFETKVEGNITTIRICIDTILQKKYRRWCCGHPEGHEHRYKCSAWVCGNLYALWDRVVRFVK